MEPVRLDSLTQQTQWDGELDSLEAQGSELLQEQLRLMRTQITTTLRHLTFLRGEVIACGQKQAIIEERLAEIGGKACTTEEEHIARIGSINHNTQELAREGVAEFEGRLDRLEKATRAASDDHRQQLATITDAQSKRMDFLERLLSSSRQPLSPSIHRDYVGDQELHTHQAALDGRLDSLESLLHESVEKQAKLSSTQTSQSRELDSLRDLLRERCDGLTSLIGKFGDARSADVEMMREALTRHAKDIGTLTASRGQISALEEQVSCLSDHLEEIQVVKASLTRTDDAFHRLSKDVAKVFASVDTIRGDCEKNRVSLQDLMGQQADALEFANETRALIAESEDKQDKELRAKLEGYCTMKDATFKFADSLALQTCSAEQQATSQRLASLERQFSGFSKNDNERLTALEQEMGGVEDRRISACNGVRSALDQAVAELDEKHARLELALADGAARHAKDLEDLRSHSSDSQRWAEEAETMRIALRSHKDAFDRSLKETSELRESLGTHSRELASLQLDHSKLSGQVQLHTQELGELTDGLRNAEDDLRRSSASIEALEEVQRGQHRDTYSAIDELRTELRGDVLNRVNVVEAGLGRLLEPMESAIGELRDQLQELRGSVSQSATASDFLQEMDKLRAECLGASERLAQEVSGFRKQIDSHKKDMQEVMTKTVAIEEHAKKSETSLKHMVDSRRKELWSQCSALGKRMDSLESAGGHSADKLAEAVKGAQMERSQKLNAMNAEIQSLKEAISRRVGEETASLSSSLRSQIVLLASRTEALEQSLSGSPPELARAMSALQSVQSSFEGVLKKIAADVSEMQEAQSRHTRDANAFNDARVRLNEIAEVHAEQLASLKAVQDEQEETLRKSLREMSKIKESQAKNMRDLAAFTASRHQLSTVVDRHTIDVEALKLSQADHEESLTKRAKEFSDIRDAQQRLNKAVSSFRTQLGTLTERVTPLESGYGDLSERLSEEMQALRSQGSVSGQVAHADAATVDATNYMAYEVGGATVDQDSEACCVTRSYKVAEPQIALGKDDRLAVLHARCVSLGERVDALETVSFSDATKPSEEIRTLQAAQHRCANEVKRWAAETAALRETVTARLPDQVPASTCVEGCSQLIDRVSALEASVEDIMSASERVQSASTSCEEAAGVSERVSKELGDIWRALEGQSSELVTMRTVLSDIRQDAVGEHRGPCVADIDAMDLHGVRDAVAKLVSVSGKHDANFDELRMLFSRNARHGERLDYFEQLFDDHGFYAVLPERFRCLERKTMELFGHRSRESDCKPSSARARSQSKENSNPHGSASREGSVSKEVRHHEVHVARGHSAPRRSSSDKALPAILTSSAPARSMSAVVLPGAEGFRALQGSVAQSITVVNDRKNIYYDPRLRRATISRELPMKRRFFGSDYVDEPTAEWGDEAAVQPMLADLAFLYEVFTVAAREQHADNRITVVVVRCRNRLAKRASDLVRVSLGSQHSGEKQGLSSVAVMDRTHAAQQWEQELAQNRVILLADALVAHGIPQGNITSKVDDGVQDCYYVEFQFHLQGRP